MTKKANASVAYMVAVMVGILVGVFLGVSKVEAQVLPKNPYAFTFTIKDAFPAPGMYCSTFRPPGSFEESSFVTFDQSLVTIKYIESCMKKLPKGFEIREEVNPPLVFEDRRISEVPNLTCSYMKPVGGAPRFQVGFINVRFVRQEMIDQCFKQAQDGPNTARQLGVSDI